MKELKIEITTTQILKKAVDEIYNTIPEFEGDCLNACKLKKCNFECCTVTGCAPVEAVLINSYIKRKKLNLPLVKEKSLWGYILPNTNNVNSNNFEKAVKENSNSSLLKLFRQAEKSKCLYLSENGCQIYEQRPTICRLFGFTEEMLCEHAKNKKIISREESFNNYLSKLIKLVPLDTDISII